MVASVLCALAATAEAASAATVSGLVFNDFNTNGHFDNDETHRDVGLSGFEIRAFTGTNTEVGHAVSGADGHYTMHVPNGNVRLELSVSPPWFPSRYPAEGPGIRSDMRFVNASHDQTGIDFGVHRPGQFAVEDPTLFWAAQFAGPPGDTHAPNPNNTQIAIRGAPYSAKRPPPNANIQSWDSLHDRVERATFAQVGTVFGLALDNRTNDLYAGAYYKRFAGLKDRQTGTIFEVAPGMHVSTFAEVPNTGADHHPTGDNIDNWVNGCGTQTAPAQPASNCDNSWNYVGHTGLGSVAIDPQDQNLYTVNLHNNTLYRYSLGASAGSARAHGRHGDATGRAANPAHSTEIPDPECPGGPANWRPFSLTFDQVNNRMYLGGVCDAQTTQDRHDLRAVVYRVDDPTGTPRFVKVLEFRLDYERAPNPSLDSVHGGVTAVLGWCRPNPAAAAGGYCRWTPWPTLQSQRGVAPTAGRQFPFGTTGGTRSIAVGERNNADFPQLTAISFAEDGSMILGFRDLLGDMGGPDIPGEIGPSGPGGNVTNPPGGNANVINSTEGAGPMLHGDMLRAGAEPGGQFSLEDNGHVAGLTSAGQMGGPFDVGTFAQASHLNWGYGPGVGPGGPGGYFYNPRPLATHYADIWQIPLPYQGGLTTIPGFADVVATSIHIRAGNENGLLWRDNADGDTKFALQNYTAPTRHEWSGFAKANGLGDITAFKGTPPLQIGNRVWCETNHTGIQEAGEPGVAGTIVQLVDGHDNVIGTTRTDSQGEYVFNIAAGTSYTVRVPLDQSVLHMHNAVPVKPFAGDDRRLDSNGQEVSGFVVAHVGPHAAGENDFTFDFGFFCPAHPPPPPPQPPPPQPPSPPAPPQPPSPPAPPPQPPSPPAPPPPTPTTPGQPEIVPKPPPPAPPKPKQPGFVLRQLVLVKRAVSVSGRTVNYELIVRDGGGNSVADVQVCDRLPAGLTFVGSVPSGHVSGGRVCWQIASMASGEERAIHLTARLNSLPLRETVRNCSTATTTTPRVPSVSDCATVAPARAAAKPPPPRVTG